LAALAQIQMTYFFGWVSFDEEFINDPQHSPTIRTTGKPIWRAEDILSITDQLSQPKFVYLTPQGFLNYETTEELSQRWVDFCKWHLERVAYYSGNKKITQLAEGGINAPR
jgi:hypothetical protein